MKIGSLFDGSGGFPLAGTLCEIEPVWASEVEPYPIAVTRSRFPNMKHLGDISKVNGAEVEPVDIITFGSPCQDLSVAGKRAGLKHEDNGDEETTRSGLFMEAVRIIKEMRKATNGRYPRFAVWENVPGAFSSNKGEDFRIVLQELIKIAEPNAVMPEVPPKGWAYADSYCGDGWSLAYRVFDAQYWGVPQRRRRIYLVADFRGGSAEKILFEREGLRGYFETGRTPWQTVAHHTEGSVGADDREGAFVENIPYTLKVRSGCDVDSNGKVAGKGALIQENLSATLATSNDQYLFQPVGIDIYNQTLTGDKAKTLTSAKSDADHIPCVVYSVENHPADSRVNLDESGKVQTLTSRMGTGGGNVPMVMEAKCFQQNQRDEVRFMDVPGTLTSEAGMHNQNFVIEPVVYAVDQGGGKSGANVLEDMSPTLTCTHGGEPAVAYGLDRASFNQGQNAKFDFSILDEQQPTLTAKGPGAVCCADTPKEVAYSFDPGASRDVGVLFIEECGKTLTNGTCPGHHDGVVVTRPVHSTKECRYIVRRLTPTECARLQGFPDKWGHTEHKTELTDDEYRFWLEVRKTHEVINGRAVKDYNEKQMLAWYNKLWTDSAEYKMWGNGIALPCALYVMQGIKEVLVSEQISRSKWLDELLRG